MFSGSCNSVFEHEKFSFTNLCQISDAAFKDENRKIRTHASWKTEFFENSILQAVLDAAKQKQSRRLKNEIRSVR